MTSLAVQPGEAVLMFHDARSTYLSTYKPGGHFECHHGRLTFPEVLEWGAVLPTNIPGTFREYPNWRRKLELALEDLEADPRWHDLARVMRESGRTNA